MREITAGPGLPLGKPSSPHIEVTYNRKERRIASSRNRRILQLQAGCTSECRGELEPGNGFAFVTMNDAAQASAAMSALNGREVNGRTLTVNDFCCCMDFLLCRECLSRCLRDLRTDII